MSPSSALASAQSDPFNATNTGPVGASSEPLLPALSTYVQPGTFVRNESEVLGTTDFRCALTSRVCT